MTDSADDFRAFVIAELNACVEEVHAFLDANPDYTEAHPEVPMNIDIAKQLIKTEEVQENGETVIRITEQDAIRLTQNAIEMMNQISDSGKHIIVPEFWRPNLSPDQLDDKGNPLYRSKAGEVDNIARLHRARIDAKFRNQRLPTRPE